MTKSKIIAGDLFHAMQRVLKTLDKTLCDKCPTCDGTVSKAKVIAIRAMNSAVKKVKEKRKIQKAPPSTVPEGLVTGGPWKEVGRKD